MKTRRAFLLALLGLPLLGALLRNLPSIWRPRFDRHAGQTVATIVDVMFPGGELPAASSLGIPARIVAMSDFHDLMAAGVAWLDNWAARQGMQDFSVLGDSEKQKALEAAFASKDETARQFVYTIRFYAGSLYYAEPAIKKAFLYTGPPQPAGFPDFTGAPQ